MTDDEWDDEDEISTYSPEAVCVCGSMWFRFVGFEGAEVEFTVDDLGTPMDTTGHPVCANCGIEYPIVAEDYDTGEIEIRWAADLLDPDEWGDDDE